MRVTDSVRRAIDVGSWNGSTCERKTPHTRLLRSIQKYVLARPAHARLPAARPVGNGAVLIRKLNPHFLDIPGNSSMSWESDGIALFMAPISRGPMWFCAM